MGNELRHLNPDERTTALLIKRALEIDSPAPQISTPGIYVWNATLKHVLESVSEKAKIYLLHENGEDIAKVRPEDNTAFVISDHVNFSDEEMMLIDMYSSAKVSIGPLSYHADHCITVVHNWLDRQSPV